jgi:hypothetical protein
MIRQEIDAHLQSKVDKRNEPTVENGEAVEEKSDNK